MLSALLWDVDGVLAETERDGHRVAFNRAFEDCGLAWRWDETRYGELLRITGGRERLLHDMNGRADAPASPGERDALAQQVHSRKNLIYAELVREGRLALRDGVLPLLDECRSRGVPTGIVTTTSRVNVEALLHAALGPDWERRFACVVCGEDVASKKPAPDAYLLALAQLGLAPLHAVAIEDSPGGVAAARAAGVPVVVTRSSYFADATIDDALAIGPGLDERHGWRPALARGEGGVRLADIEAWLDQGESLSQWPDLEA